MGADAADAEEKEVNKETEEEDAKVKDLQQKSTAAQAAAGAARKRAAEAKTGASRAAQDAANAAAKAKAQAEAAKKVEAENEDKVHIAEHKAADADAAAKAARDAAAKAEELAKTVSQKLHDAKCHNVPGCSGLEGYCCPTFNPAGYKLGDAPQWGVNLGCCGAAAEEETLAESEEEGYNGFTMAFSMVASATVGAMGAVALVKARGRKGDVYQQLIA